jgi:hypothetical protein
MKSMGQERSAAFEMSWSVEIGGDVLTLAYEIAAKEELYVGDRLWDHDAARRRVPDPFGVYRFVEEGSLRLVFAQAPCAPGVRPRITYAPLFSRMRAGETHRRAVEMRVPVDEYSSLERDTSAPAVVEEVSRVVLVMSFRRGATIEREPAPPLGESAEEAWYIVHAPELLVSSLEVDRLPVRRRTGDMARFAIPR